MFITDSFRYYAIATPSATQRLLLGLLEAPPSWAPDALDAAVQLVELLRAAEDYASGIRVSCICWCICAQRLFYDIKLVIYIEHNSKHAQLHLIWDSNKGILVSHSC